MTLFYSDFAFVYQSSAEWGGGLQLWILSWKKYKVFDVGIFLLLSRSNAGSPHRWITAALPIVGNLWTAEIVPRDTFKLWLREASSPSSHQYMFCRSGSRTWLRWVPSGLGTSGLGKECELFLLVPSQCTQHFWAFPSRHRETWPYPQRCPALSTEHFNTQHLIPVLSSATSHLYFYV